jgi:hypothetical protein
VCQLSDPGCAALTRSSHHGIFTPSFGLGLGGRSYSCCLSAGVLFAFQNSKPASFPNAAVGAAVEMAFASSFPVASNDSRTGAGLDLAAQLSQGQLQNPPQTACSSLLALSGLPADTAQPGPQIVKSEPGCVHRPGTA